MAEMEETTVPFKNLTSREYPGHKKKVHSVAWNCTGTKLASGSVDQTARVWHIEPHGHGKVKDIELKGHTDSVDQLCWDPKHADLIATASGDKTVRLWDARSGKCAQLAELSGENINITYKPDGTHIAVGNRDDELTILDVRKFKPIHKRKFNYEVNEIAWSTTSEIFFLTTGNGTVEVLAYPSLRPVDTLMAHTAGCYCIAIDPLGRYFAVGSADSLVSLWDISEMLCVRTFTKLESPVRTISFNNTGEYLASASEDLFIDISNVQTGRTVHQIPCRAAMNSVEWNPKSNLLAYAGDDKNKYQTDEGALLFLVPDIWLQKLSLMSDLMSKRTQMCDYLTAADRRNRLQRFKVAGAIDFRGSEGDKINLLAFMLNDQNPERVCNLVVRVSLASNRTKNASSPIPLLDIEEKGDLTAAKELDIMTDI
ncbi:unnamed protein product [Prunus armeniaca]|uniref:Uncharacterized protein n=1 Tax=Prunus armeniaca TaxID=36596 RepID=A0A6J5XJV5_PRUAR|nr:unnamed protein product [Prunus armeniaca]